MAKENKVNNRLQAGSIDITYFTDPLCCWSWAFEPQWRKLQYEYKNQLTWRYCMGGLLPSWNNFIDTVNAVNRPLQMGPVWMHASHISGMHIEYNIWARDPPASSYPACIAVKCAQLQSEIFGEQYLRMLREEVMLNGVNISREEVLIQCAELLSDISKNFDSVLFEKHLYNNEGLNAFKEDMQLVNNYNIKRFPTFIIRKQNQQSVIVSGYRSYSVLAEALKKVQPDITISQKAKSKEEYQAYWLSVTQREVEEEFMIND